MIVDVVVLAILLISIVIAFLRGFIREILTILGVVGGVAAMVYAGPLFLPLVRDWLGIDVDSTEGAAEKLFGLLPYTLLADILAYGGVFLIVVIILSIVSHLLSNWANDVGLGAIDRTLGVLFGFARGAFLLALLYLPVYLLTEQTEREEWTKNSRSGYYIETATGWLASFLPELVSSSIDDQKKNEAQSVMKETRKRLQEIDILRSDAGKEDLSQTNEKEDGKSDEKTGKSSGYEDEQRQEINQLFEDGSEGEGQK